MTGAAGREDESSGPVDDDRPDTAARLLEGAMRAHRDHVAVVHGDVHVTYAWLDHASAALGRCFLSHGASPDRPVALLLPPSVEVVLSVVAAARIGVPYMTFDVRAPGARLAAMLEDAAPAVTVVTASDHGLSTATMQPWDAGCAGPSATTPVVPTSPAYVIFTSGSTGRPKGVLVHQEGLANLVASLRRMFDIQPHDRASLLANLGFDATVAEMWSALGSGATVVVVPPALVVEPDKLWDHLEEHQCSVTFLPTPVAEALFPRAAEGGATSIRVLWTGGDRLRSHPLAATPFRVWNLYGPTEVSVASTAIELTPGAEGVPTIGWPLGNLHLFVVDATWTEAWRGARGELWVGGDGVALGYVGDPAKTAERFVPDPDPDFDGARVYRTGDIVRWTPSSGLSFEGRADHQVKIRGQRVEVGEIEHALRSLPGVRDAIVVVHRGGAADELAGYVVGPDDRDYRRELRALLPEFMVPTTVQAIASMPLTSRGKVDRASLPAPTRPVRRQEPPVGDHEVAIARAFSELLGVDVVGRDDGFFELGGHSLLATRLVARLWSTLGVRIPVRAVFETASVRELAIVARDAAHVVAPSRLLKRPPDAPLELSWAQERMWFLQRLSPDSAAYNVPSAVWLVGPLDRDALARAIAVVESRHEPLRTIVEEVEGKPVARLAPAGGADVRWEDHRGHRAPEASALSAFRAMARRPFDLSKGPLLRVLVARVAEHRHLFGVVLHHIAADGWSTAILVRELGAVHDALVSGRTPDLPWLPIAYGDYAWWQRRLAPEELARQVAYWTSSLSDVPATLELPLDRRRPRQLSGRAGSVEVRIGRETTARLGALASGEGATPFMALLSAFQLFISRQTGVERFVVGTPVANRSTVEVHDLVGLFVNTLALRCDVAGAGSFRALLRRVRASTTAAFEHEALPFERLVDELELPRELARTPLVQVMFSLQTIETSELRLRGLAVEPVVGDGVGDAKFDLSTTLVEADGEVVGRMVYQAELFDHATVERWARRFEMMVSQLVERPDASLSEVDGLTDADRAELARAASPAAAPVAACSLGRRLLEEARRHPDRVAVVAGDDVLTYAHLMARATALACAIMEGTAAGEVVPLVVGRTLTSTVAIAACALAGRALAPLDVKAPAARLEAMIGRLGARRWLTDGTRTDVRAPGELDARTCVPRRHWESWATSEEGLIAYVIHTSGSTGTPKPVAIEDASLHNLVDGLSRTVPELGSAPQRVSVNASLSFDASMQQVWQLLLGHTLVQIDEESRLDPRRMLGVLRAHDVTVFDATPSHVRVLLEEGLAEVESLAAMLIGGEVVDEELWRRLSAMRAHAYNVYGPAETTVDATCGAASGDTRNVGVGLTNVRLEVVDGDARPVGVGVPGELLIGGCCVGVGYLGMPSETARVFVPDPSSAGGRRYRTGDVARVLRSGALDVVGRRDGQVKIRGHRIELGEVEAALASHRGVRRALVTKREAEGREPMLVAYVVPSGADELHVEGLEAHVRAQLPDPMVPTAFVVLDSIPLNASGKVDLRALPAPHLSPSAPEPPASDVERVIASTYAEVLGVGAVGRDDGFFALGGHSLLVARILSRLRSALEVELPVRAVFESPRVRDLARRVERERSRSPIDGVPRIEVVREGSLPTLVLVHGRDGRTVALDRLTSGLDRHGVRALEIGRHTLDLGALVEADLDLVRRGPLPVVLMGWSLGALFALELARRAPSGTVAGVVLLDPHDALEHDTSGALARPSISDSDDEDARVASALRALRSFDRSLPVDLPTLVVRAARAPHASRLPVFGRAVDEAEVRASHMSMLAEDVGETAAAVTAWLDRGEAAARGTTR